MIRKLLESGAKHAKLVMPHRDQHPEFHGVLRNRRVAPELRVHASLSDVEAPVAQGIEHRPPEAGAEVRILAGALHGRTYRRAQ